MKITPIDIQRMVFKVRFRGYAPEEVNHFLEEVAQTVEKLNRENGELRDKLSQVERHLAELKKSESTLSNTLISVQTIGEELKHTAKREAELVVKEAELKASELIREARSELTNLHRDISELRKQKLLMIERLRSTIRTFERALEIEAEPDHSDTTEQAEKFARESHL